LSSFFIAGTQSTKECITLLTSKRVLRSSSAQQSVHLTLGILRQSQAVFHALSFFWLDGFAVPAPAQVTQTVSLLAYGQINDKK
jgi:hypothetical protein